MATNFELAKICSLGMWGFTVKKFPNRLGGTYVNNEDFYPLDLGRYINYIQNQGDRLHPSHRLVST